MLGLPSITRPNSCLLSQRQKNRAPDFFSVFVLFQLDGATGMFVGGTGVAHTVGQRDSVCSKVAAGALRVTGGMTPRRPACRPGAAGNPPRGS